MEKQQFDIIVIGGGPGGYPAAIKAAQNGKKVALIEAKDLGGTCLNRGCIPSKTLISSAEVLQNIKRSKDFGIDTGKITFDYSKMVKRKDEVVSSTRKSLEGLIKTNNIHLFNGFGKFISPKEIKVTGKDNALLEAENIIIATGSEPRKIDAFPFDYKRIHDSTSLLEIESLPKSIVIIGGGIIGCEFASLFANLDVKVTILELLPRIIPMEDLRVSEALTEAFKELGVSVKTQVHIDKAESKKNGVVVHFKNGKPLEFEIALVAVGRSLNTQNIGLEKAGVFVNDNGIIPVDERMETNVPGIYAVGDIASKWWLAHVATHQGLVAASNACGDSLRMDYNSVPSVIFTHPEIATVGKTLENAQKEGYDAKLTIFPFNVLGKSKASMHTKGFVQIVVDKTTNQILGAQVIGHAASTLIAEMAIAVANELTLESVTDTIHAHPTISEAWLEAALLGSGNPLHLPPPKKRSATTQEV